jgi:hypothetical protein
MNNKIRNHFGSIITICFVLVAFFAIYYTAVYFRGEEEKVRSENPIIFCQPIDEIPENQKCFFTTHIHTYITIKIFGEEKPLHFEHGDLANHHTHSQANKIHWHTLVEVDPITKKIPDSEFKLGKLFDDMDIYFDKDGILEYRNNQINPNTGEEAKIRLLVNSKENLDFGDYIWEDKDVIEIIFE